MKTYSAKIRHAGNIGHEIPRVGLTAAEIQVLRHIHGEDAVVDIRIEKDGKDDRRPHDKEVARLRLAYGANFDAVFGKAKFGIQLPNEIDNVVEDETSADVSSEAQQVNEDDTAVEAEAPADKASPFRPNRAAQAG